MRDNILVVGSDGYIGSILCKKLQEIYDVIGYDTGYYRGAYLYSPQWNFPKTTTKDIRLITVDDVIDIKAVICLSDLNDPLSQIYPGLTKKINYHGLARFASMCKETGVEKFLYSSSASVYGVGSNKLKNEKSELSPLTPYAECKTLMEKHLLSLCDDRFSVACLRNSTVYGLSPSMRFDLVINYLCGTAVTRNIIELKSDGGAWRPFVHIEDVCDAFVSILDLPTSEMSGLIVNIGDGEKGNSRVIDIAHIIQEITSCDILVDKKYKDKRSYCIESGKLNSLGIQCQKEMKTEIIKILNFLKRIELSSEDLNLNTYTRLEQIRYLLRTRQIDQDFFWI